jgi:hypothetical protein
MNGIRWFGPLTIFVAESLRICKQGGLVAFPLPGEGTQQQLARMIGDIAGRFAKLLKTLRSHLRLVAGAKSDNRTDFGNPNLADAVLQPTP